MKVKYEAFTIVAMPPSAGQVTELLEQVERQGYEPKFLFLTSQGAQVYGRKEEPLLAEDNGVIHAELSSPESELPVGFAVTQTGNQ